MFQDELIATGQASSAQITLLDQTNLSIGATAVVRLDEFVYDPNQGVRRMVVNATKGVMRFAGGQQRPGNYEVVTPTATLGIRGTVFDAIVPLDPPARTVLHVHSGVVTITCTRGRRGSMDVVPGQTALCDLQGLHGPNSQAVQNLNLQALYQQNGGGQLFAAAPTLPGPTGLALAPAAVGPLAVGGVLAAIIAAGVLSDNDPDPESP